MLENFTMILQNFRILEFGMIFNKTVSDSLKYFDSKTVDQQ